MRRSARAFTLGATLLSAACAGHGITLSTTSRPADPALLLSCARSVASEHGLAQITQSSAQLEARTPMAVQTSEERGSASYDVLTVKLSRAKEGLRMLVGSATYALRGLRAGGVGSSTVKTEWVPLAPSEQVALARDAVLNKCGTLGN